VLWLACLGVSALVPLPGCVSARPDQDEVRVDPEVIQSPTRFRKEYVLVPGDEIEVLVRRTPEVSRTVALRPDGYITLPLFGDIMAAGHTPGELDAELTRTFSTRLLDPEVTVIATRVRQPMVYVIGEVMAPKAIPLRDAPTAMQAVALAGGLAVSAARHEIALMRLGDDGYLRAFIVEVEVGGQPGPYMALHGILLKADDVIFVPERGRTQVARIINDLLVQPLLPFNLALNIVANFRLVQELNK